MKTIIKDNKLYKGGSHDHPSLKRIQYNNYICQIKNIYNYYKNPLWLIK
jgi:hypothetical protein